MGLGGQRVRKVGFEIPSEERPSWKITKDNISTRVRVNIISLKISSLT